MGANESLNRENRFTEELCAKLSSMGAIITKADKRAIRQAFERHFKEVHEETMGVALAIMDPERKK